MNTNLISHSLSLPFSLLRRYVVSVVHLLSQLVRIDTSLHEAPQGQEEDLANVATHCVQRTPRLLHRKHVHRNSSNAMYPLHGIARYQCWARMWL
jgi:hypothetical protein